MNNAALVALSLSSFPDHDSGSASRSLPRCSQAHVQQQLGRDGGFGRERLQVQHGLEADTRIDLIARVSTTVWGHSMHRSSMYVAVAMFW